MFSRDSEVVELSFNDWLDGIQKTVKGSIQEQQDKQSEGDRNISRGGRGGGWVGRGGVVHYVNINISITIVLHFWRSHVSFIFIFLLSPLSDESYLFVPCPLSSITKMMAESVAKNFQLLFEYVYLDSSDHFSDSMMEMLRKYSTDVYSVRCTQIRK